MSFLTPRASVAQFAFAAGLLVLSAVPGLAQENKVVATVNGQNITEDDLALAENELEQRLASVPAEQRRAIVLSRIIDVRLMADEAMKKGLDKDPTFLRHMAFLKERALYSTLVNAEIGDKITDEEIRARFDKEIAAIPPVDEIKARHILVKTREEADEVIKRLEAGDKFEDIAREKSTDTGSGSEGGDLGYFARGQMVPEFEKAAFDLEPGKFTTEPVQSQFGWHIIKVEDKRVQQPPAFDELKEQFRSLVLREKYAAFTEALRKAASVDIVDPELKKAVEETEKTEDGEE